MHRDTKLGLALGILLVGIVGALFFRNDAVSEADVPRLDDPQSLDKQIAEKPLAPYLTGIETDAVETRNETQTTNDKQPSLVAHPPSGAIPDPVGSTGDDPQRSPFGEVSLSKHNETWSLLTGSGADFRDGPRDAGAERRPAPNDSQDGSAVVGAPARLGDRLPSAPLVDAAGAVPAQSASLRQEDSNRDRFRFYQVQKGETLSALAAHFLGSSAAFQKIFDANRDVLDDPDDVWAGMTLRIPAETKSGEPEKAARSGASGSPPTGSPSHADGADVKRSEQADEGRQRRFIPVRRFPFVPRRSQLLRSNEGR